MRACQSPLWAAFLIAGCAAAAPEPAPISAASALPKGGTLSPDGFLTISEVPASPYPDAPPPEPAVADDLARRTSSRDPAVRAKAWEDANGSAAFQAELERLREVLAREQRGNFVDVRLVRDPAVAAEIWFKRDAAQTLARYTTNPQLRARQGGLNQDELQALQNLWVQRSEGGNLITTVGTDPFTGTVELGIAVEEADFRREAARRGWSLEPNLTLLFPRPRPPAFAEPELERFVRIFARETNAKGIQLLAGFTGRIVLEDGCFRLARGDASEPAPLVMFGRETQLGRDAQGYLIVRGEEGRRQYRIGEIGSWGGPNGVDEADPQVQALLARCGSGPVVNVAEPESQRLFALPDPQWVADYARAMSMSYGQAWDEVIGCMKRLDRAGRRGLDARDRCIRQFN
ncbi:MAG TPA: hypothetical protein VF655_05950 [Allosphingosinicella sp.]|jgi:hypothetical protein